MPGAGAVKARQLSYVADIVAELQRIARANGYRRLAIILGFALSEARRQQNDVPRSDPPA